MTTGLKIAYIATKSTLSEIKHFLNKERRAKRKTLFQNTRGYRDEIVAQLRQKGFDDIQDYSLSTWKFYGIDRIRLTFLAMYRSKKYVIKATRGFEEKINNSIRFQTQFNDVFSFIPKGFEVQLNGYVAYATEHIEAYPFQWAKYIINAFNLDGFLQQANDILDQLEEYRIVHCDLESVNLLITKDYHIILIDWDTCCSDLVGLHCDSFPKHTIKIKQSDGQTVYDDAYSFCVLFERMGIKGLEDNRLFQKLQSKIGRNVRIVRED